MNTHSYIHRHTAHKEALTFTRLLPSCTDAVSSTLLTQTRQRATFSTTHFTLKSGTRVPSSCCVVYCNETDTMDLLEQLYIISRVEDFPTHVQNTLDIISPVHTIPAMHYTHFSFVVPRHHKDLGPNVKTC